jgi:hypothetical protein
MELAETSMGGPVELTKVGGVHNISNNQQIVSLIPEGGV